MTWSDAAKKMGRRPFTYVEIDLDFCPHTFGSAPCPATGTPKCFNTFATCRAKPFFDRATGGGVRIGTTKTYRFCIDGQVLPPILGSGVVNPGIPSLRGVTVDPTTIDPTRGLGIRSQCTVVLQDHPYNDRDTDPYVTDRTYDPMTQGAFWGRFLARNPYVEGRTLRLYQGFLDPDDGAVRAINFQVQTFIIQKIEGPSAAGKVTILAKDLLKLADDNRVQIPPLTLGALAAGILAAASSLTLSATSEDALLAYPAGGGFLFIDSEVINYSARAVPTLVGATWQAVVTVATSGRGKYLTVGADHSATAKVQLCQIYVKDDYTAPWNSDGPTAVNVIRSILTAAGIADAQMDLAGWAAEQSAWFASLQLEQVLTKPTGGRTLLLEVCESAGLFLWWDTRAQVVKLRAIRPALSEEFTLLTDREHLVAGTVNPTIDQDKRVSRTVVYYGVRDHTADNSKPEHFNSVYVAANLGAESVDQYGPTTKTRTIYAKWLPANGGPFAAQTANRLALLYGSPPMSVALALDVKDGDLWTGGSIAIQSRLFQGPDGAQVTTPLLITQARDGIEGRPQQYVGQNTFQGRWLRIQADGAPNYADATEAQRLVGGYLSDDNGQMPDGSSGYRIA